MNGAGLGIASREVAVVPAGVGLSRVRRAGGAAAGVDIPSLRARSGSFVDEMLAMVLLVLMAISAVVVSVVVVGVMAGYIS